MNRPIITALLFAAITISLTAQVTVPFDVPTPTWEMLITLNKGDQTPVFQKANASSNVLQSQCGEDCSYQWGSNSYTPEFWDRVILNDSYILPYISQGYGWVQFEFNYEITGWAQARNFRKVQISKLTKSDIESSSDILAWEQGSDLYVIVEDGCGPGCSAFWIGKLKDGYVVCPYICYLDMNPDSNHPGILNGVVGMAGISKFTKRDVDYIMNHATRNNGVSLVVFKYINRDGDKITDSLISGMTSFQKST